MKLTKQELRKRIFDLIRKQKEDNALRKSRVICDRLVALPVFQNARTILFYASVQGEVDTFEAMDRAWKLKKRVVLPVVQKETKHLELMSIGSLDDLYRGAYNIPEPKCSSERAVALLELDLVIVPGVAFDRANNRLGRGAGYYDRFLAELPSTTATVGLAYDFQIVDDIGGLDPHDQPVSCVIAA